MDTFLKKYLKKLFNLKVKYYNFEKKIGTSKI
jgi:hypothetical protein